MNKNIRTGIKNQTKIQNKNTLIIATLILFLITITLNTLITLIIKNFYSFDTLYINIIIEAIEIIILAPITLGYMNMFLKKTRQEEIKIKDLFKSFSPKFIILNAIILTIYLIIYFLLSLIPFIGNIINAIILIMFLPFFFYLPLIYIDNKNLEIKEIFIKTLELVSGRRIQIYAMIISYIGLIILSFLTLGILFLYTIPCIYLALTHLYLYYIHEKEYQKEKSLKDSLIILIFLVIIITISILIFIKYPTTLDAFKTKLLGENYKIKQTLTYGDLSVNITPPENYKLQSTSTVSKTYTNGKNILQYSIYMQTVKEAIEMDKEIVNKMKQTSEIIEENFIINNKNTKIYCYMYEKQKTKTIIAYEKIDNYVITISLTGKNINKNDIKKYLKIN